MGPAGPAGAWRPGHRLRQCPGHLGPRRGPDALHSRQLLTVQTRVSSAGEFCPASSPGRELTDRSRRTCSISPERASNRLTVAARSAKSRRSVSFTCCTPPRLPPPRTSARLAAHPCLGCEPWQAWRDATTPTCTTQSRSHRKRSRSPITSGCQLCQGCARSGAEHQFCTSRPLGRRLWSQLVNRATRLTRCRGRINPTEPTILFIAVRKGRINFSSMPFW